MSPHHTSELLEIVNTLKQTRKYRNICDDTLLRIADNMINRYKTKNDIIKATKSKLHQIYGAYVSQKNLSFIETLVNDPRNFETRDLCRKTGLKIMELHASTRERLPFLSYFFSDIFDVTGQPGTICDVACGLLPFAIPWMELSPETVYIACDIDARLINVINRYLSHLGMAENAVLRDVVVSLPEGSADVVFLLKTLPCLEQQEKHISLRILKNLHASHVVVSFPAMSLGGKKKGMQKHYGLLMRNWISELDVSSVTLEYRNEIVYILNF